MTVPCDSCVIPLEAMLTPFSLRISLAFIALLHLATAVTAQSSSPTAATPSPAWQRLERYSLNFTYPGSQLRDHVYGRATKHFALGDAARDELKTPQAVRERQERIRQFMIESVGGLPPSNTPLNPRVTGTVQGNGFTIEKIIFESRPRHYVTANLYLPAVRSGRTSARFASGS